MPKFPDSLSKEEKKSAAITWLKNQNVQVGVKLIKPPFLCGIGTWGTIDYLINEHKMQVVSWDSPLDV